MLNKLKSKLVLIKETKFWFLFLKFFFVPLYDFFWQFIINFQGKIYYYLYNFKKKNSYNLENNDTLLIKNNPKFIEIANEINNYIDDDLIKKLKLKLLHHKEVDKTKNQFADYRISFFDELNNELKEKIIDFAISDENVSTATKYLKVFPIIGKIIVYLNVPISNKEERGAMLWHKDDFGYKSLDIFMTIRDLDIENGPLYYVKPKHPLGVFFKIKNVIKNALPGERNKVDIINFKKFYTDEQTDCLKGKSGDGLFIDSFTAYHRGGYCLSKDRIMLRISYQTPEATRVQNLDHSNGNFFLSSIKKSDTKNIFKKYLLFKKLNFIGKIIDLPNLLIFIYKLMHFKK